MLLRAILLGLSFSAVGLVAKGLPPLLLTSLRFFIAATAMLPLVVVAHRQLPTKSEFMIYGLLGLCQAIFFGGMFWAAHRTSAVTMTVLYVSVPFLTYCLGILFQVERPNSRLLGTLAVGAIGALGLAWADSSIKDRGAVGGFAMGAAEGVFFAGCISLAIYGVVSKWGIARCRLSGDAAARTFWSLALGGVIVGAFGLLLERPTTLARLDTSDILLLAYLGVLSTGGTFYLLQRATAVLSPTAVSAYSYAPPFVSMLLLFATDPQTISWRWVPGALLVLLAIALLQRRDSEPFAEMHGQEHAVKMRKVNFPVGDRTMARTSNEDVTNSARASGEKCTSLTGPVAPALAQLQESEVMIKMPVRSADAYFVHPKEGAHPGVLVWPDALSVRPAFRSMAKRLATSGYSVLVINPFYRTQPAPIGVNAASFHEPAIRKRVMRLIEAITPEMTLTDASALVAYLDQQRSVDTGRKLGVIGYCMGGEMAIATASVAPDRIGAVASFHGANLVTPEANSPHRLVETIRASALIAIAEDDDEIDPKAKVELRKAFNAQGLDAEIEVYQGARHGWCPPDTRAYNEAQAERAWSRMLALFASELS